MSKLNEVLWTREQLWEGCILASIAHAIMVGHYPEIAHEHSWDGINYNVQDSEGTRGTITFHPQCCVAAFRDESSHRISSGDFYWNQYFRTAPSDIIELAQAETLQYLLDHVDGKAIPVITTAFWGQGNKLLSSDSWIEIADNGGAILEIQGMGFDSAIEAWIEYYDMNEEQVSLMRSIYERKILEPNQPLRLLKAEIKMIGSDNQAGLAESKTSFEEIGIVLEL